MTMGNKSPAIGEYLIIFPCCGVGLILVLLVASYFVPPSSEIKTITNSSSSSVKVIK